MQDMTDDNTASGAGSKDSHLPLAWAAVIGLAVGLAIGFVVFGDAGRMRGTGPGGLSPSDVAGGVPPGTWSKVDCEGEMPLDILDEIQAVAVVALDTGQIPPYLFTQINDCLLKCAIDQVPYAGDQATHCMLVREARDFAHQGQWQMVFDKMNHGH